MTISKRRLKEIKAIPDEDIDYSDIPELGDDFFRQAEVWMPPEKPKAQLTVRFDGELSLWRASLWRANGHDAIQSPAACQNERRRITVKVSEAYGRPRQHPEPEDRVSAGLTVWLSIDEITSEIGQAALLTSDVEVYAEVCPENVRVWVGRVRRVRS